MQKTPLNQIIKSFFSTYLLFLFIIRIFELITTQLLYGFQLTQFSDEMIGFAIDLLFACVLSLLILPIVWLANKIHQKFALVTSIFFLVIAIIIHIGVVSFFIVQLYPIDTFLYYYTKKEILYTVTTSGIEPYLIITGISLLVLLILLAYYLIYKRNQKRTSFFFTQKLMVGTFLFLLISIVFDLKEKSNYIINKSAFIFQRTIEFVIENNNLKQPYQTAYTQAYQTTFNHHDYISSEFPYLHQMDTTNVWDQLFEPFDTFPNIVFLLVEGLNDDFIHPIEGIELMPFLVQLKEKSIYYDHAFTLGERSFATLPTSIGGLPYGEKGFMLQPFFPNLMSLIGVLKKNGYLTSYFHGQNGWFHNKDGFLRECGIDLIVDNQNFDSNYEKIFVGEDNFFWGYNDWDLMEQSLSIIDTIKNRSRFDIFITGSTHAPFRIANEDYYNLYYDSLMHLVPDNSQRKTELQGRKKNYKTLLFADDAFRMYFEKLQKRADYQNTIFIITGDHPMTEVHIENSLKRYHVPILVFSEKLKKPIVSHQMVSQLDIYETLLAFLRQEGLDVPVYSASLGAKLDINTAPYPKKIAFMNDNREIVDYVSGNYYLSRGSLYKINENLAIEKVRNKALKKELKNELTLFKRVNYYTCQYNKLYPDSLSAAYYNQQLLLQHEKTWNEQFSSPLIPLYEQTINVKGALKVKLQLNYSTKQNHSKLAIQMNNASNETVYWISHDLVKENHALYRNFSIPFLPEWGKELKLSFYIINENSTVKVDYFNCRVATSL